MKFFKILIIFIVTFLLSDRLLYISLIEWESSIYSQESYFTVLGDYLKKNKPQVLLLGSSRASQALYPVYIESTFGKKVYKEALCGKGPKYNYYFYKKYKEIVGVPELVIYGVDYFIYSLSSNRKFLSRFRSIERESSFEVMFKDLSLLHQDRKNISRMFNNFINKMGTEADRITRKEIIDGLRFSQKYLGSPSDKRKIVSVKPKRVTPVFFARPPGIEGDYFLKLLEEFHADGVKVMLLILPDYYGTYYTHAEKGALVLHLKGFEKTYKNISVHNYNMPNLFPLKKMEFFRDGGFGNPNSHLSAKGGAYLFKKHLLKDIKNVLEVEKESK